MIRLIIITVCFLGIVVINAQPPVPSAKLRIATTKPLLTPKAVGMAAKTITLPVKSQPKPINILVISWQPNEDGANVATKVETTTNLLDFPQRWNTCYVGKGTNFQYNNEWTRQRFFRATNIFTNF